MGQQKAAYSSPALFNCAITRAVALSNPASPSSEILFARNKSDRATIPSSIARLTAFPISTSLPYALFLPTRCKCFDYECTRANNSIPRMNAKK